MPTPIVQRRGGRQESKWVSILLLKIWKVPQPPSQNLSKPRDARTWAGLPISLLM